MDENGVRPAETRVRWRLHETALAVALFLGLVAAVVLTLRFAASDEAASGETPVVAADGRADSRTDGSGAQGASSRGATSTASGPEDATLRGHDARAGAVSSGDVAPAQPADIAVRVAVAAPAAPQRAVPADPLAIGRFAVFGEEDASRERTFGERVAIEGNVALATAWFRRSSGERAEVRVFERRGGVWTKAQTLEPPQYAEGFANDVCISRGRIVVAGGYALGTRTFVFRSYVRGAGGVWTFESETPIPFEDFSSDWVLQGNVLAGIGCNGGGLVSWKFADGAWTQLPSVRSRLGTTAGSWIASGGDTIACFSAQQSNEKLAFFRIQDERPRVDLLPASPPPDVVSPGALSAGALGRGGAALVTTTGYVTIFERGREGWTRTLASRLPAGVWGTVGYRSVAADGDLAVIAAARPAKFVILERREDGWYSAEAKPPAKDSSEDSRFTYCASVAMSGRAVICGTRWDGGSGGRVVFFDVTDENLAAATKIPAADR